MNTDKLEKLIDDYTAAIYGGGTADELNRLTAEVEAEADRIGYTDHRRLMALHTAAEKAGEAAEEKKRDDYTAARFFAAEDLYR